MTSELKLRDYQDSAIDMLRKGFAEGHRAQILYLGTGGGKTETSIAMLEAARKKGSRSAIILDRIVLCDQTSKRLDRYSIDHGVLQSGHWRYRPSELIQVCSAQTIEKRGSFPGLTLLVVDECHAKRKQTIEFIKNNPHIKVVGLSASPFTKGLGEVYTNVVSPITTKQLVDEGSLVPIRVFISKEIDMDGAKKVAGEWSEAEATKRGMQITGDICAEWIKKTHEIYGKPEKTIVFCSGVTHGADIVNRFAEHGYNFVSISYKDDDEYKREVIEDFEKPDSEIIGLVACDVLTKGFDNPLVKIAVSARPFSKSFSSHVQQMGRIMRPSPGKDFAIWLDHAGNYLRFQEDWDYLYEHGVDKLNEELEKARKEKPKEQKEAAKCPKCEALWPRGSDTCTNCGHTRERRNFVAELPGIMEELSAKAKKDDKQAFWSMCRYKVVSGSWSESRALATYKEKFGVWPRQLNPNPVMPDIKFEKYAKSRVIAYLKGKQRGAQA